MSFLIAVSRCSAENFAIYLSNVLEFLSFQDLLQQQDFPALILNLCQQDPKSFVRASALKCLQQMIRSAVLWKEFFEQQQLPVKKHQKANVIFYKIYF